jgi:transcription-repair coupling factor (superfamily II helicase)
MIDEILHSVQASAPFIQLAAATVSRTPGPPLIADGLGGSIDAVVVAELLRASSRQMLLISQDTETADQWRDDLTLLLSGDSVLRFYGSTPSDIQALRSLAVGSPCIVVTHPMGLLTRLPAPDEVRKQAIPVKVGGAVSLTELRRSLADYGFGLKDFVEVNGEYAVRGGILDIFPFVGENPLRIEFVGDSAESIREFDPLSQRSIRELSIAVIVPDLFALGKIGNISEPPYCLPDFLNPDALVVVDEPELVRAVYNEAAVKLGRPEKTFAELETLLQLFPGLYIRSATGTVAEVEFGAHPQPSFNTSVVLLRRSLAELQGKGFRVILTCDSSAEVARLKDLLDFAQPTQIEQQATDELENVSIDVEAIQFSQHTLHQGFVFPASRLAVYTEHQIFNRLKRRGRKHAPKFRGITDRELQQLQKGDYVVHADFGIGRFAGLSRILVGATEQEVVKVQYAEQDTLYVHLNYINRLQKYSSKEGHVPKLTRLGSPEWDRLKSRTKARVKDIARSLIQLYAQRKARSGYAFSADTPWQKELEASFLYEDTFDQAKATREVKQDMESSTPMDRLICGDVGFGKTEVAVRAAFKAVMDGKQVAILVPTTILAMQHFNTFLDRTARYGVRLQVLSRFQTRTEQLQILGELRSGATDIVIGTHRLLSKDVQIKNLGLLIIDEEHRFGVAAKEKLRQMRAEVDTLALTATPIPRTLHFSLMGARDLSIIATPPRNRLPILTEVTQWGDELIRDAVMREVQRGGQVYVVHDRIQNIDEITEGLKQILPGVRIAYGHGQMHTRELEDVMMRFLEKKIDVLVSTKIIESGLDIPNVNTIIINRADRFGMAELYQLRGRVGRSNLQAFGYLFTPPLSVLPTQTVKRIQALQEFNELGSGFNLAMRDLEIRGAGNLLGAEQSGFIESLGFETYTRVLEEAVQELKAEEFQGMLKEGVRRGERLGETVVEPEFEALIPGEYISGEMERLAVYRRLYGLTTFAQLDELEAELRDRFGKLPWQAENLLGVVRLRLWAARAGFKKVAISESIMQVEFPPESDAAFYESESFQRMMQTVSRMKKNGIELRQQGSTLKLVVNFRESSLEGDPLDAALEMFRLIVGDHT